MVSCVKFPTWNVTLAAQKREIVWIKFVKNGTYVSENYKLDTLKPQTAHLVSDIFQTWNKIWNVNEKSENLNEKDIAKVQLRIGQSLICQDQIIIDSYLFDYDYWHTFNQTSVASNVWNHFENENSSHNEKSIK